jgi:hypothetical protein
MLSRSNYYRHALADILEGVQKPVQKDRQNDAHDYSVQDIVAGIADAARVQEDNASADQSTPILPNPPPLDPMFADWGEQLMEADPDQTPGTLLGELLLYYFEWMAAHKVTDASARAVHGLLRLLLPKNNSFPAWTTLKNMLEQVHKNYVIIVDLCPNNCIAYWDPKHAKLAASRHSHRTKCPKCSLCRFVTDATGETRTVKVGYYFPIDNWMFSMFKDPDLQPNIDHDCGEFPPGHTRRSHGFHAKVTNNPQINVEPRNQALVGMADAIPLFRDMNARGVVPIALRQANQPDSISKLFTNIHLCGLYPCDYWVIDDGTGLFKRQKKNPSNISPLLVLLTDDLLFWYEGKMTVDYNLAEGDPGRNFLLRADLLFWCGDYPGLGEATNFKHKGYNGCHWCKDRGVYSKSLGRMVLSSYRRYTYTTRASTHSAPCITD